MKPENDRPLPHPSPRLPSNIQESPIIRKQTILLVSKDKLDDLIEGINGGIAPQKVYLCARLMQASYAIDQGKFESANTFYEKYLNEINKLNGI